MVNIDNIFEKIATKMVDSLMFHDEMSTYYHFLGLDGYKECHNYHYLKESNKYSDICEYYMCHYDKILKTDSHFESIIPIKWYQYSRQEIDNSTKRTAIKNGIEKWIKWESDTMEYYQELYNELIVEKEFLIAKIVMEHICNVDNELKHAKNKLLFLKSIDYDLNLILSEQHKLEKKYKCKKKEIFVKE